MAEIINLNRVKKTRDKSEAKARAAENRAKFGRSKTEKATDRQSAEALRRHLDDHKRDTDPG
jgi:hypothetical protein